MGREIVFNSFKIPELINLFAAHFHTKVQNDGVEEKITVPGKYGSGEINALDFKDGLSILIFSCELKEELILKYKAKSNQPLRLIFCVQNEISHTVKADGLQYKLSSMQSSMVSAKNGSQQQFTIAANTPAIFFWIDISRKKYHPKIARTIKIMPVELRRVFEDVNSKHSFLYFGGYSLAIAQLIQNLIQSKFEGVVRRVYLESQTLEIMSLQIKQFIEDLAPGGKQKVLRKGDQQLIMEARAKLLHNLVTPPTIKELAQMMGTNENKLKAGFRLLYDTSINKLLQDERLSKAKLLMAEEAFPIKEIAKMVGYKHSAHFASKFKKRFGVLPNEYIKSMLK